MTVLKEKPVTKLPREYGGEKGKGEKRKLPHPIPPLPYPGEPQGMSNKSNTSLPDKRFLMRPSVFIVT